MSKYYKSIDNCPIILFIQIQEGKKQKTALCFEGEATEKESEKAWNSIYKEYVEEFGVSDEYKSYLKEKSRLCQLYNDFHNKKQLWKETLIKIKKQEIASLEERINSASFDFNAIFARLSQKVGFHLEINKLTIREFYAYINS